jgi:2-iminobutanoate/2-iminopropanoate deaminase
MREVISTPNAPSFPLYSQGIKSGGNVYVTGLVGIDVATGQLAGASIQLQTRQALINCRTVLEVAGATLDDVVEVGVLLADPTDFPGMNDEYGKWFPVNPPTRYTTKLGAVIPGVLISIRMIAITE